MGESLASSIDAGRVVELRPLRSGIARSPSLAVQVADLRARLDEAEDILRAIRSGEVDALFVDDGAAPRILALGNAESPYRVLVEAMAEGAAILDVDGTILYANRSLASMLRTGLEQVIGGRLQTLVDEDDLAEVTTLLAAAGRVADSREARLLLPGGATLDVRITLSPMVVDGQPRLGAAVVDMTEPKRLADQLRSLSLTDDLTGLCNLRGFRTLAEQELRLARRARSWVAVLFGDLDDLKGINDQLGHDRGSQALVDVADVLRRTFRDADVIARLGGDEFAVFASVDEASGARGMVRRLEAQIAQHNRTARRPYRLSLSIGVVARAADPSVALDDMVNDADAAMYAEKRTRPSHRSADAAASPEPAWPTPTAWSARQPRRRQGERSA
jgi:diguanylate cyclase (GGDEF)-like protein/PAS domain S-box-containing protein